MELTPDAPHSSALFAGLQLADPSTLADIKSLCYKEVVQAVERAGGTYADGDVFYRTALVELSHLAEAPAHDNWATALKDLAVAHFLSWLRERGQVPALEHIVSSVAVPDESALRDTRRHIFVWNQLLKLSREARLTAIAALGEAWEDVSIAATLGQRPEQFAAQKPQYLAMFRTGLRLSATQDGEWPDWVIAALKDTQGWALWQALQAPEEEKLVAAAGNKLVRNIFILAMALMLGYMAYIYLFQPKTAEQAFDDNFNPPESFMSDQRARYGAAMGNDSVSVRPGNCILILREADNSYKQGRYDEAQDALLLLALDTTGTLCQSDAWFYLGIIRLELNDPQTALECFAKIDNLELYGEDVYWYQALCFVKLVEKTPRLRPQAARAIQRFIQQTQDPQRRAKAEKMMDDLSE